jgi:hypothetical protein
VSLGLVSGDVTEMLAMAAHWLRRMTCSRGADAA